MDKMTIKVVFDRKHKATNANDNGSIEVEVIYARKQRYFSTGIKCPKKFWDASRSRSKSCLESESWNERIDILVNRCNTYYNQCLQEGTTFDFDGLKRYFNENSENESFVAYMARRIEERTDIRESTKKQHRSVLEALKSFGGIVAYPDLTIEHLTQFDEWMANKGLEKSSRWTKHKTIKHYINEAVMFDKMEKNPYAKFKPGRGDKRSIDKYLTEEEINRIKNVSLPESLDRARDLMVFQFYTGLAVSDLMRFSKEQIFEFKGIKMIKGTRFKTGVEYICVVLPEVQAILDKYDGDLPTMSDQAYNRLIKAVCASVGINKNVSSHWLRRSNGMMLANKGVPFDIIARELGHTDDRVTRQAYAKVNEEGVAMFIRCT